MTTQPYAQAPARLDERQKALVIEYMPLVKFVASRIHDRLPAHVELEDLEHAGVLGLMGAVCRYDETHANMFKTYAEHRIRGAILDELRKNDFMTRTGRDKYKLLEQAVARIEQERKREATSEEIAEALGMKMEEYFDFLNDAKVGVFMSLDDMVHREPPYLGASHEHLNQPERKLWLDEIKKMLADEIEKLRKDERLVLSLYYYEELTLREIGEVMERTESRICQIHNEIMAKLARRLKSRLEVK